MYFMSQAVLAYKFVTDGSQERVLRRSYGNSLVSNISPCLLRNEGRNSTIRNSFEDTISFLLKKDIPERALLRSDLEVCCTGRMSR